MDIFNSFYASGNLLSADNLKFANVSDPEQDRQNIGPDLDPNRLKLIVLIKMLPYNFQGYF